METHKEIAGLFMSTYDTLYNEPHLFGEPYPEFVAFIEQWTTRGDALDLGCGQGRDALMLAAHGFNVTAIDTSATGVEQMLAEANARGLTVNGIVADFYAADIDVSGDKYDLIVLDAMLHFEKADRERELGLLRKAADQLRPGGLLCLFIHKSAHKEGMAKELIADRYPDWPILVDRYIDYVYEEKASDFRTQMQFNMFFVQRPK